MALKTSVERYYPGNLPDTPAGLIQFLYDELWRISEAFAAFPAGVSVDETDPAVPVSPAGTETRLFENIAANWDLPGGRWDATNGEWETALNGLYQINLLINAQPVGGGNKDMGCKLTFYLDDVELISQTQFGADEYPLAASMAISGRLLREHVVRATITLFHENITTTTEVFAAMSISSTANE